MTGNGLQVAEVRSEVVEGGRRLTLTEPEATGKGTQVAEARSKGWGVESGAGQEQGFADPKITEPI
eukprot:13186194-Alexandrium_andersonii.AAC.2